MMIVSALPFPKKRASVVAMTDKDRKMTDEPMTLREKSLEALDEYSDWPYPALSDLCDLLEDTGSPAHMRVAKELRGEE